MITEPTCPVCSARCWQTLERQTFTKFPGDASQYVLQRLEVLFDVWTSGLEQFEIVFMLCTQCGMVIYSPRPKAEDLHNKYAHLAAKRTVTTLPVNETRTERVRARELYNCVEDQLPKKPASVLDYGGGRGALMSELIRHGHQCCVVDYVDGPRAGVKKLGDRLEDIPSDARFDLIISSHVFEHLADPLDIAGQLRTRLNPTGALFVEVPMELWGGVPTLREPVTHVNFFCESSLRALLERAGFSISRCWTDFCTFSSGNKSLAIRALATAGRASEQPTYDCTDISELIQGNLRARLRHVIANPKIAAYEVLRLKKRIPGRRWLRSKLG